MTATNTSQLQHSPLARFREERFWREHFPALSLDGGMLAAENERYMPENDQRNRIHNQLHDEGYFRDRHAWLEPVVTRLADATVRCVKEGIPPQFLFLFDEPWACFYRLRGVIADILGEDFRILPDFWLWHVDYKRRESGWKPHRDKGTMALDKNGDPLSLTIWIPLSEATPMNGCMYMLPANLDPYYNTPDSTTLPADPTLYRALPAVPGEYLCWNQAVLHYGGRSSSYATHPRMSMALEFQRGDISPFNKPLLPPNLGLSFKERFRMVCKQVLQYQHMYPLAPELEAYCRQGLAE